MKRFGLLSVVFVLCFSLIGCQLEPIPTRYFNQFDSIKSTSQIEEYCAGKANWLGTNGISLSYGYTTGYDEYTNPAKVVLHISPSVVVGENDEYIVIFTANSQLANAIVYKNGEYVTGKERDNAVNLALKKVENVPHLVLSFQMEEEEYGIISYTDFNCFAS